MQKTASIIFKDRPDRWFLRGEPFLWNDLETLYSQFALPLQRDQFESLLNRFLTHLLYESEYRNGILYVERYAHGGMSSGCIDLHEFENHRRPLLLKRLDEANSESLNQ